MGDANVEEKDMGILLEGVTKNWYWIIEVEKVGGVHGKHIIEQVLIVAGQMTYLIAKSYVGIATVKHYNQNKSFLLVNCTLPYQILYSFSPKF